MDPIDRQALIAELGIAHDCSVCEKNDTPYCRWHPNPVDVCEAISNAPTIEPEKKTGKWMAVDEQPYFRKHFHRVYCSNCNTEGRVGWGFCPNCGADMRGEQDG